jgi:hypothetical protein
VRKDGLVRSLGRLAVAGGISAGAVLGSTSAASAGTSTGNPAQSNMGCPSGYIALTVTQWEALGPYHVPALVDSQANGGNGDGIVCGNDIGKNDPSNPSVQLYQFRDNDVPG